MDGQCSPGPVHPAHFGQNQCNNSPEAHTLTLGQTGDNCSIDQLCQTIAALYLSCYGNTHKTEPTQSSPTIANR